MSTKILDNTKNKNLQPSHALWKLYDPENALYRFKAKTLEGKVTFFKGLGKF